MSEENILKYINKCKLELVHHAYLDGYSIQHYKNEIKKYLKLIKKTENGSKKES